MQMEQIQAHSNHLQQHANHAREQKDMIAAQLHEMREKYDQLCGDNKQLVAEIKALRQSLQVCTTLSISCFVLKSSHTQIAQMMQTYADLCILPTIILRKILFFKSYRQGIQDT